MSPEAIQDLIEHSKRLTFEDSDHDLDLHRQFWGRPDWYGEPQPSVDRWLQQIRDHFSDDIRGGPDSLDIGYQPPKTRTELSQQSANAAEDLPFKVSCSYLAISLSLTFLQQPQDFEFRPTSFDFGDDCRFFRAPGAERVNCDSFMVYIRKEYRRAQEFIMEDSRVKVYMVIGSPGGGIVFLPIIVYPLSCFLGK